MSMLPGPVSNAKTSSGAQPAGSTVMLPMPPIFCKIRVASVLLYNMYSVNGTSGAPWPPAARSATRKSETVTSPVSCAITAPSPICTVQRAGRPQNMTSSGACQMVCPCEATASTSVTESSALRITESTASA